MKPIRTSESDPFTDEDRARVERIVTKLDLAVKGTTSVHAHTPAYKAPRDGLIADSVVLTRALAHINHLEAALGAADELAKACDDLAAVIEPEMKPVRMRMAVDIYRSYRSARASMREDAG